MVTIWIGGNNLCSYCKDVRTERHREGGGGGGEREGEREGEGGEQLEKIWVKVEVAATLRYSS